MISFYLVHKKNNLHFIALKTNVSRITVPFINCIQKPCAVQQHNIPWSLTFPAMCECDICRLCYYGIKRQNDSIYIYITRLLDHTSHCWIVDIHRVILGPVSTTYSRWGLADIESLDGNENKETQSEIANPRPIESNSFKSIVLKFGILDPDLIPSKTNRTKIDEFKFQGQMSKFRKWAWWAALKFFDRAV